MPPATQALDRQPADAGYPEAAFLERRVRPDRLRRQGRRAIRFSYSTDPAAVARPGWFIDDLKITTGGGTVLYSSDFEDGDDDPRDLQRRLQRGGLAHRGDVHRRLALHRRVGRRPTPITPTTSSCATAPASTSTATARSTAIRSASLPGLLLGYTNEAAGYGNTGQSDATRRTSRRSTRSRQPGNSTPNLNDAAFTGVRRRTRSRTRSPRRSRGGWVDNYKDATTTRTPTATGTSTSTASASTLSG